MPFNKIEEIVGSRVIVLGRGGLGNQLFQLAYAHSLSNNHQKAVSFHLINSYKNYNDVSNFNLACSHLGRVHSKLEFCIEIYLKYSRFDKLGLTRRILMIEESADFEGEINKASKIRLPLFPRLISGFWQDWRVIESVAGTFVPELKRYLKEIVPLPVSLDGEGLITVHVRRGDLLSSGNRRIYGVIDLSAYRDLLSDLRKLHPDLTVVTVTDSPEMIIGEGAGFEFGKILGPEECTPWQVLKLMENSRIVVSANSTLSWWGSYLAMTSGAKVLIPDPWYANFTAMASENKKHPKFETYQAKFS